MKEVSEEVWEIAQDLYNDADFNINRYGEVESFTVMDFDDYDGYYRDCKKSDYEEAKVYLNELLKDVKYYDGNLELNDNRTLWDIEIPEGTEFNEEEYSFLYDQALEHLEEEIGEEVYGLGRSGRHICVADTFRNLTKLDTFKEAQEKWEQWLINEVESSAKEGTEAPVEEGLNKGEKKARCLSCGVDVIYTNRDVCHDIDGDYIECPNCNATFDVDYDNISPLLNKKTESYQVWQRYFEDGEIARPEYVQSFDTFEEAQKFVDGLNEDPNCEAWIKELKESKKVTEAEDTEYSINNIGKVNKETGKIEVNNNGWDNILGINNYDDLWKILDMVNSINLRLGNKFFEFIINLEAKNYMVEEAAELSRDWLVKHKLIINLDKSNKVTEAEDMTQVKDDVKSAVEKSDSTKQEKDQVKGSIDVLKTDEESAISGYEEFNKETAKVVDKELANTIDNQMQEIVDDEKEHIEKLDTIKSALGESKLDYEDLDFEDSYIICKDCYDKEKDKDDYTKYKVDINNTPICANCGKESMDIDYYKLKSTLGESKKSNKKEESKEVTSVPYKTEKEAKAGIRSLKKAGIEARIEKQDDGTFVVISKYKKEETLGESERGYITGEVEAIIDGMTDLDKSQITGKLIDDVVNIVSDGKVDVESPEFDERVTSTVRNILDGGKKEELFNNSINLNVDAGDIASGNNLDLGGLGALAGLMASEETKESEDKLEEADETSGTATIDLHTDLVPIINMYQYNIYQMLDDYVGIKREALDEMMLEFAEPLIEEQVKDVLPSAQITFGEFTHPKYYRLFSNLNDVLNFSVTYNVAEYEALKEKAIQDPAFEQYLKDHYTSYDGFMSFFANNISDFEEQEDWKQFVSVLSYYLPNNENENYDEMCNYVYENASNYDIMPIDSEVEYVVDEINNKVDTGEIELNKENVITTTKELMSYLDEDDLDIIINEVLKSFNLEESKKEELFDNTADINVNANDIGSNNTLDLGGLGDLLGMTEAKLIEAKNNTKYYEIHFKFNEDDEAPEGYSKFFKADKDVSEKDDIIELAKVNKELDEDDLADIDSIDYAKQIDKVEYNKANKGVND